MKPEIYKTVKIEIPISVFSALKQTTEEFAISMRIAAAVLWYEQGMVSQEYFIMALKRDHR